MHEHLDEVGVIHMNARLYDPLVGRFMSADDIVPNPKSLKSYNRYSYVANNPLKLVDRTGHEDELPTLRTVTVTASREPNDDILGISSGTDPTPGFIDPISVTPVSIDISLPPLPGPKFPQSDSQIPSHLSPEEIDKFLSAGNTPSAGQDLIQVAAGPGNKPDASGRSFPTGNNGADPTARHTIGVETQIRTLLSEGFEVLGKEITLRVCGLWSYQHLSLGSTGNRLVRSRSDVLS